MTILSHNEIELLEASIKGNTAAFESVVKKYQSFVCAITYSAIADVEKSEDMAQETFLHAWNNLSKLKDLSKFKSWLITITRNIISDSLRKQKRDLINKAAPIEEIENVHIKQVEPDNQVMTSEQQAVVYDALMQIPEKYREPLVLFYRQGQSVKNIAGQLDLSEELVKQHLSRGRKMLREQVASMVESTISKTGPTKAFTSIVMASIAGLAVKGTATAAAAAGSSVIMSSLSAKIITAAAVIAIGFGTVITYNHFVKQDDKNEIPNLTSITNNAENNNAVNNTISTQNTNTGINALQESAKPETASLVFAKNDNSESLPNNIRNTSTNNISANIPPIALTNKPVSSPYEYFLFTRFNRGNSTNTLILAHITDNGIELKEIITAPESSYHWGNMICVAGGKLYCRSFSTLYSIDLLTKETDQLSVRSKTPDYSFDLNGTYALADGCLYGLAQNGNTVTLRQLDFQRQSYRDITDVTKFKTSKDIAVSPDRKRLAYFAMNPKGNYPSKEDGGYFLTVIEIETGKISQPAKPIQFVIPMIASTFPGIPIIWLDSETVAFIRTEIPEGEDEFSPNRSAANMLTKVNVNTGEMEDITPLPGNPYMQFAPSLIQDNAGTGPLVQPQPDHQNNYRLDLKNHKLIENDSIAGNYRQAFDQLYYKDIDLGTVKTRYYKVSPDGKRIIWMSEKSTISNDNENKEMTMREALSSGNGQLYYHDEAQNEPIAIAKVYNSTGLWLKAEDLNTKTLINNLSSEWSPLNNLSQNNANQNWVDTRKNIKDYLNITIKTDKSTYYLHEPVKVTLTATNKSNTDITINKPHVIVSVMRPLVGLLINYPGGQTSIDKGAQPYSPEDEKIMIKAGESFATNDTIEVSGTGEYSLEYTYEIPSIEPEFKGNIRTQPAAFTVTSINGVAKEKQLFNAKFARIMEKFYKETAKDPNWNGNNNVSDEMIGLPGMGPEVAPYIIKAIENEKNKISRQLLLTALCSVADSEYIPYFKDRLINGETDPVCNWLLKTYTQSGTNENIRKQAVEALIAGMSNTEVEARQRVCSFLTKIYDRNVETCFVKAVEDENQNIKLDAGFYLAAAKWLELAEWLKLASNEPDYAQYISACTVVKKLEQQFNITKGNLPTLSKEDFEAAQDSNQNYKKVIGDWLSWAQENPRASFLFFEDYRQRWWENDPLRQE
ncbi:MAG: sigma-70 family RNA polymerase sigma factor [Sedimentisphaerales bacterium]|nr:sigma-70 family RNA polymerase sigma factor [Sedimentisphaerales bacterium]